MSLADDLRALADDRERLWTVARAAIEDELVDMRDHGMSLLGRNNGLVIRHASGGENSIIRMGPEDAVATGLRALADHLEATS